GDGDGADPDLRHYAPRWRAVAGRHHDAFREAAYGASARGARGDIIEAGFPISSTDDFNAVATIAREVRRPVSAGLARATRLAIERAAAALEHADRARLHTFLATSSIHLQHKLKITQEQCLEQAVEAVEFAKSLVDEVEFSPEDALRTD